MGEVSTRVERCVCGKMWIWGLFSDVIGGMGWWEDACTGRCTYGMVGCELCCLDQLVAAIFMIL